MADITISVTGAPLILPNMTTGQTYPANWTILSGGVPVDLTTYTSALWEMALGPPPAAIVLAAVTNPPGNGYLTWNSSGGLVMAIPAGITASIPGAFPQGLQYQWELKLVDGAGIVSKPVGGTIAVIQSIAQ